MAADIGAAQTEHGCADEPEKADADRGEQRLSQDAIIDDLPSTFVVEWLPRVVAALQWGGPDKVRPTAIDLAMGRGRHARLLALAGLRTFGVDMKLDAVKEATARARSNERQVAGQY